MTWVVVGRERSGDEDENVSPVEAIGPFESWKDSLLWLQSAPTFQGATFEFADNMRWLLDLFGVPLRNPDLDDKETGE